MASAKTVVLITGANSGIGYETALLLSSLPGYEILVCARSLEKATAAISTLETSNPTGSFIPLVLDVTSQSSITAAYETVAKDFNQLDVLINNAGIIGKASTLGANIRETFETNSIGPAVVTEVFEPLLLKSPNARLIHVSSGLGSLSQRADPKNPFYALPADSYRMSKAALNMLTLCHHFALGPQGVKVWAYCPGYVVTNLSGTGEQGRQERVARGATSPVHSAEGIADMLSGKRDADVGKFVHKAGVYEW